MEIQHSNNMKRKVLSILYESRLNDLIGFSDLAFRKFVLGVEKSVLWDKNQNSYTDYEKDYKQKNDVKLLGLLLKHVFGIVLLFCYSLFIQLIAFVKKPKICNSKNIKYLFLVENSKLSQYTDNPLLYGINKTYYLPSFSFRSKTISKSNNILPLPIIGIKLLLTIILFFKKKGLLILSELKKQGIDNQSTKIIFDKIIKILIYKYIAKENGLYLKSKYPHSLIIVQNDFSGLFLCLVDYFSKNPTKVCHVQHGYYVSDDFEYSPLLSNYMLCCSSREKHIQIQKGVKSERLFTYGAPYQTLTDIYLTEIEDNKDNCEFDILLLGRNGSRWKQEMDISFLEVLNKFEDKRLLVRHHPKNIADLRGLWKNIAPFQVNSNYKERTLIKDISESNLIITFSVDALISCLTRFKKVIFCANFEGNVTFNFLENLPNVKVVENSFQLNNAINYFLKNEHPNLEENEYNKFLQHNFGFYSEETIHKNFFNSLEHIYDIK